MSADRTSRSRLAGCAALLLFASTQAMGEEVSPLRFDPFRPLPKTSSRADSESPGRAPAAFDPSLRSTVVAGEQSMVNLGGAIMAIGEEKNGYRLIEVHPFDAVFERDGKRVRIEVERAAGEQR